MFFANQAVEPLPKEVEFRNIGIDLSCGEIDGGGDLLMNHGCGPLPKVLDLIFGGASPQL